MDAIYKLKQQMLFLEQAHAAAGMGHFILDPKQKTVEFSSWVRDNIGLSDTAIPIERLSEIVPEEDRDALDATINEIIKAESGFTFETNVITAKGAVRMQRVSVIPAFENEVTKEGLIGFYGIVQEITREQEVRQNQIAARNKAQAELEIRTNILAAVSHEIRTPLGGIIGIIDQLKREISAAERERALVLMQDSCQALLETLDGILQQACLSQNADNREAKRFRPGAVAQRVAELFRPLARRKAIRIEVRSTSEMEAMGDPSRVQQVLSNLVSNAVKFTQSGVVTLDIHEPQSSSLEWTLVVSDTGAGIDENRIERIFQPFDTSGEDSLGKSGGAGLGLSITRDIIDAMGGRITVESSAAKGTQFTIMLPLGQVSVTNDMAKEGNAKGHLYLALEKATEQIQAEAMTNNLGWTLLEPEDRFEPSSADRKRLVVVADHARLESLPSDLLDCCERILIIGKSNSESLISNEHRQKTDFHPAGNILRELPQLLERVRDDAA